MFRSVKVRLSDLILSFSSALDFVDHRVSNHHLRVAIIASAIAKEFGLSRKEISKIFLASTLHDIGVFSVKNRLDVLDFEVTNPSLHAERGYQLIKDYGHFSVVSKIIRHHHTPWEEGKGALAKNEDVPIGAHIVHIADRIEVLIDKKTDILGQADSIMNTIKSNSNTMFMPDIVKAFESLAAREYFWFDAVSPEIIQIISSRNVLPDTELDIKGLMNVTKLFSHIIDYRSRFTAVHSSGVSSVATLLAEMVGFSESECQLMRVAGHLHDVGKLAIPMEILEKPAKLSVDDFNIVKSHVYHSYRILEAVPGLELINIWGSFHHERIDGQGYPFHIKGNKLPLGSRIMAVADVFTALTEDRPYRKSMAGEKALKIIEDMAKNNALDASVVKLAGSYFKHLNEVRKESQVKALESYSYLEQL